MCKFADKVLDEEKGFLLEVAGLNTIKALKQQSILNHPRSSYLLTRTFYYLLKYRLRSA
jgi:hypothetical protein